MKKLFLLFLIALTQQNVRAQFFKVLAVKEGKNSSIRGMSIVNDDVAWVSGSKGWIAKTTDGAKSWEWMQIPRFLGLDFRDIEAFSANEAIVVNAGSPAYIFKTVDGGKSWQKVYENTLPEIFLDGMAFADKQNGTIYGDPIKGKMVLLQTTNGGITWQEKTNLFNIDLSEGEAAFAASGTGIHYSGKNKIFIATGGTQSRLFTITKKDVKNSIKIPVLQGLASTGVFSIAVRHKKIVAVGGDYVKEKENQNISASSFNEGKLWQNPVEKLSGYKSCVEFVDDNILIATGTSGTDFSLDNGLNWQNFDSQSFNVCKKAKSGSLILIAGSKGRIGKVSFGIKSTVN